MKLEDAIKISEVENALDGDLKISAAVIRSYSVDKSLKMDIIALSLEDKVYQVVWGDSLIPVRQSTTYGSVTVAVLSEEYKNDDRWEPV